MLLLVVALPEGVEPVEPVEPVELAVVAAVVALLNGRQIAVVVGAAAGFFRPGCSRTSPSTPSSIVPCFLRWAG